MTHQRTRSTTSIRLDIPVLLPGVKDDQDACVARLVALLDGRDGIERVHVVHDGDESTAHAVGEHSPNAPQTPAALCLHYDPDRIALSQIQELAKRAGAAISDRYKHAVISFREIGAEDEGSRLEAVIRAIPGVTAAVVNYPAQMARVEFDSSEVALPHIMARLVDAGAKPQLAKPSTTPQNAVPIGDEASKPEKSWYSRNAELAWSLIAGALTLTGWILSRAVPSSIPSIVAYALAYAFGARDNVGHLLKDLRRGCFHFNIDFLMVVAAIGAAVLDRKSVV